MPLGAVPAFTIVVAWVANSFIRPNVKRSAAIAICNTVGKSVKELPGRFNHTPSQSHEIDIESVTIFILEAFLKKIMTDII